MSECADHSHIFINFFRYDITGLTEEHLKDAMALNEARDKILQILYNGESVEKLRLDGGKARLLVGHDLEHDLDCLRMNYPEHMLRYSEHFKGPVLDNESIL